MFQLLYICVFGESLLNDAVTIVSLLSGLTEADCVAIAKRTFFTRANAFQVLYHALSDMAIIGTDHIETYDFVRASGAFFLVALGGVLIGILACVVTGLTTRLALGLLSNAGLPFLFRTAHHINVLQPLICLLFPYMAYLLAEMAHYSGILAYVAVGSKM